MIMTVIKKLAIDKEELEKFLQESFLELRHIAVHKIGCCSVDYVSVKPPRNTINIEEILFYISYKDENLDNTILDFSIQRWVKNKRDLGIKAITFDNKVAANNKEIAYFYSIFNK